MRLRWYYIKRALRANRVLALVLLVMLAAAGLLWNCRHGIAKKVVETFRMYGVQAAGKTMKGMWPALAGEEQESGLFRWLSGRNLLVSFLDQMEDPEFSEDPAYERLLAQTWQEKQRKENGKGDAAPGSGRGENMSGGTGTGGTGTGGTGTGETGTGGTGTGETGTAGTGTGESGTPGNVSGGTKAGGSPGAEDAEPGDSQDGAGQEGEVQDASVTPGSAGEAIASRVPGQTLVFGKLADYDYLMNSFYSVHPTTTAGRDLMSAEKFLSMDFSIEKKEEPQILIYHTHSQEEFSDYPENPEATIVGVGTYLTELLEKKGYQVIHDTGVYDLRDGKLDRSQAYTYALDGISGILQKNPSIEVVLDIHRDGVKEGTRLVKDINGKPTAQIMFFNGMSQSPDGPIEYLPNPNRDFNLGFSFQLQLMAAEKYPGFTRKIYLKGLRYNEHVRARAVLIEVGAQTNTYEEARNAMEPLSEILDGVLSSTGE